MGVQQQQMKNIEEEETCKEGALDKYLTLSNTKHLIQFEYIRKPH